MLKRRPWIVPALVLIAIAPGLVQCVRDGETLTATFGGFTVGLTIHGLAFNPFTRLARLHSAQWQRLYHRQKRLTVRAVRLLLARKAAPRD